MASAAPTTQEFLFGLIEPAVLLSSAVYHYVIVCLEAVFKRGQPLAPLLRSREIRDEAFGRFWVNFSVRGNDDQQPDETQLVGSAALVPPLLARASGVVLDIGPGTGTQMPFLRSPAIRTIYGAEPCVGLHAQLRRRALSAGLDRKYHILPSGAEKKELLSALEKLGVTTEQNPQGTGAAAGIFDTIVCVRVLCSVPDPARTIADLYDLLRPGGKMLVVEHVVNPWWSAPRKGSFVGRLMQAVYSWLGWSFFVGDCHLDRDTTAFLKQAADKDGGWETVELEQRWEWSVLPYVSGMLVKRS
ncbi:hypothetical protein VTN77DRAFT_2973 [Rasamsonia byssochlamydoides]|uniref:uncharacterized protein n=1 Tax=Rasamsonia byssochlamydoides TaxID=89139 RepID=UPI0037431B6B